VYAGIINVLIVGAGGLGLWTLRIAEYVFNANNERVRLTVADSNVSVDYLTPSFVIQDATLDLSTVRSFIT